MSPRSIPAILVLAIGLASGTPAAAGEPIFQISSVNGELPQPYCITAVGSNSWGEPAAASTVNCAQNALGYVHEPGTGRIRNAKTGSCWYPTRSPARDDAHLYFLVEHGDENACTSWKIADGVLSTTASDGGTYCLDLQRGVGAMSAEVYLMPCNGGKSQQWKVETVGQTADAATAAVAPEAPVDPNARDADGNTALHRAVTAGEPDAKLSEILAAGTSVDLANNAGDTALILAVQKNAESAVRLLLDAGANPNAVDGKGVTPLLAAARPGDRSSLVFLLLERGATPNDEVIKGAIANNDTALIDKLMAAGVPSSKVLDLAVDAMDVSLASSMLAQGAKPTNSHVEKAVSAANLDMLDILLGYGGDANVALTKAMQASDPDASLVKSALENGADGGAQMPRAVELDSRPLVTLLVDHGADPGAGMMKAIEGKNKDMVRYLESLGAKLDNPDYSTYWVARGDEDMTRFVLGEGGDAEAALASAIGNRSPHLAEVIYDVSHLQATQQHLEWAVHMGQEDLVTLVLDRGVPAQSGMAKAIDEDNGRMVDLLVARGADATPKDLIIGAVQADRSAAVFSLAKAGARVDWTVDDRGTTLLHYAASHCSAAAGNLLYYHADPNAKDADGNTPLHLVAAGNDCKELVEQLLSFGADVNATDGAGRTPLTVVNGPNKKRMLKKAGGI